MNEKLVAKQNVEETCAVMSARTGLWEHWQSNRPVPSGTILEMTRNSSDNTYLHQDFHNILNLGIDYLHEKFGVAAVIDYLRQFAVHFHAPLIEEIRQRSFDAVVEAFEKTYRDEGDPDVVSFERNGNELFVRIRHCPAVEHMRRSKVIPSQLFALTSSIVWDTISREAEIGYAMLAYDEANGKATHIFFPLESKALSNDQKGKETL